MQLPVRGCHFPGPNPSVPTSNSSFEMTCKKKKKREMVHRKIIGSGDTQTRGSKTSRININQAADCAAILPGHVQ